MRIIVAITGASGAILGIRLLQALRELAPGDIHLVTSNAGKLNIAQETTYRLTDVEALADTVHRNTDIGASIASGSFHSDAMVVAPCSIGTLSAVVHSSSDTLIARAADVVLKERRRLILAVRETPLHLGHCRMLVSACELGAVIAPPMPAFYSKPETLDDLVDHSVGRLLDLIGVDNTLVKRWSGLSAG